MYRTDYHHQCWSCNKEMVLSPTDILCRDCRREDKEKNCLCVGCNVEARDKAVNRARWLGVGMGLLGCVLVAGVAFLYYALYL